jgi:hypothetical protein
MVRLFEIFDGDVIFDASNFAEPRITLWIGCCIPESFDRHYRVKRTGPALPGISVVDP